MKRDPFLIILFSALFLLPLATSTHAFLDSDVKKAKGFRAAGMYPPRPLNYWING